MRNILNVLYFKNSVLTLNFNLSFCCHVTATQMHCACDGWWDERYSPEEGTVQPKHL